MKLLVIGRGGREHSLIWKIHQSPDVSKIYSATGNAGISGLAECVPIRAENIHELADFAEKKGIDLTVVGGPEISFMEGIVDEFVSRGLPILGPTKEAAKIEGSKTFAKKMMRENGIPTSAFESFSDRDEAFAYIERVGHPLAIKADGMTGGKGFIIAKDAATAKVAVHVILKDRQFGQAGSRVIIEELLRGIDVSVLAFTDGDTIVPVATALYYKNAYDGDQGPITGGMGAVSPAPVIDQAMEKRIMDEVLVPSLAAMKSEGLNYKGILQIETIITKDGPKVVEFHVRFGDPETQVMLPRLESDIVKLFKAMMNGTLKEEQVKLSQRKAVAVVLVSGGYPMRYSVNEEVGGLGALKETDNRIILHAGTCQKSGKLVTMAGRVVNVVGLSDTFAGAAEEAYAVIDEITYNGKHYRKDIARKEIDREQVA